ncbi:MAG: amino acid adenylation domain-containing protein, partial [Acidobacteria bacterium]|nr:amino acid adenylation domain-containing protein [Acidobacteriota bacterium]
MIDKSIENIEDIYPMSDVSKGMIYHSLKDESAGVFYNQIVYYIKDKDFTASLLEKTLDSIIRKHAMLRTGFKIVDIEEPIQIVYKNYKPNFLHVDISHMNKQEQEEYIKNILQQDRLESFDITGLEPLWRVKTFQLDEENICFLWIGHHAIMDGWSSALLMTEMHTIYAKLKSEPAFVPEPMKSTYKDFVIEQLVQKKQPAVTEFWREELEGYKQFQFWESAGVSEEREDEGEKKGFYLKLDAGILDKLRDTAINYNTSIRNLCFAAYAYMLNMNSYDDDIVAGFIMNNRPVCEDGDKIIGCFLNTVPVRVKIPAGLSWKDYIKLVDSKIIQLAKYNRLSLLEIIERTGYKGRDDNPLINTIFNYTDYFVLKELGQDLLDLNSRTEDQGALNVESSGDSNTMFDFSVGNTFGKFEINISYSKHINDDWVTNSAGYFKTILEKFITAPGDIIKKDDLIPLAQKQKLLYEFNNTQMEYPGDKTLQQLFVERMEQQPDNMALVDQAGQLTYRELNQKSNYLAQVLKEKGIAPGDITGIMIKCSLELVIGILGILKAGGVYLPIDPESPTERIDFMLKDSNAAILLTDCENKKTTNCQFSMRELPGSYHHSSFIIHHSDLSYIIYTSGSTGRPKGVLVKQRSFVNLIYYHRSVFAENQDSRMSQVANPAFDAMGFEIWPCLTSGASLHIADNDIRLSPASMRDWLIKQGITISFQPTVIAEYLLDEKWPAEGVHLNTLCAAGDKLSRSPKRPYPFKLYNLYGPTEDTVWTTWTLVEMETAPGPGKLPGIGKPIANHKVYILNTNLNLQPIGVPGELCISGDGLAEGYLNNPELTRRTFEKVPLDPPKLLFNNHSPLTTHHSPIYHTGDLARWLPAGGVIEFLGRIDYQVKIRGYRIETGEIEFRYGAVNANLTPTIGISAGDGRNYRLASYDGAASFSDTSPLRFDLAPGFVDIGAYEFPGD